MYPRPCQHPSFEPETGQCSHCSFLDCDGRRYDELSERKSPSILPIHELNIAAPRDYFEFQIDHKYDWSPTVSLQVVEDIQDFRQSGFLGGHLLNTTLDFPQFQEPSPKSNTPQNFSAAELQTLNYKACETASNEQLSGASSAEHHRDTSQMATNGSMSSNSTSQGNHHTSRRAAQRDAVSSPPATRVIRLTCAYQIVDHIMIHATPRILEAIENEMMRLDPDSLGSGRILGESKL